MTAMGQHHQFPPPEASAGYLFGQQTFAGTQDNERDAPEAVSCTAPCHGLGDASADGTAGSPALFLLGAYHQDGAPSLSVCRNSSAERLEASVMREAAGRRPGAHRRSVFTIGQPQVND